MPEDIVEKVKSTARRYKESASRGNLGQTIGEDIYDQARKATGYIDRNTPGSPGIQAQNWSMYRDAIEGSNKYGNAAMKEIRSAFEAGKRMAGEAFDKIRGSKKKGGRINKTGLYRLHRGEKVRRGGR